MKTIEARIAMFASERIQEDKSQQRLHGNPVGSPYKFTASALWAFWHHGNSVPPHHCTGTLHSFKAYAMKHGETLAKISHNADRFIHKSREHNSKDLPGRIRKNNISNEEELFSNEKPRVRKNSLLPQHKNKYLQLTMKPKLRVAAGLIFATLLLSISTYLRAQDCLSGLPESIKSTLEQDNWKIVQPGDIPMDDWKLWKNTHQGQCPGVAAGNFFPKADSSFIVALIQGNQKNPLEQVLLVTLKKGQPTTAIVISPIAVTTPSTVWKLPPGHYAGVDGTQASISRDSFVYEQVASSAKQFYYQGSNLKSFIISN